MSANHLIRDLINVRRELRELEYREQYVRNKLLTLMDRSDVNILSTPRYQATRRFQTKEFMERKNVPRNIWNRYAKRTEFEVLTVKPR
jgi:hypothetical protein